MSTNLLKAMGPLAPLFEDQQILEVMIDGPQQVRVEKNGKIEDAGVRFKDDAEVLALVAAVLETAGVKMEAGKTVYEARLTDTSRMAAILPPTSLSGPCVVFRKWLTRQITWEKLFEFNAIPVEGRDLIQGALRAHVGILISGGTASGKTTFTNRVVELIPPEERVIVAEQSHQYQFDHPRAVFFEAAGSPGLDIDSLLSAAARMRPDWLVVGELEGPEAMRTMQLFSTGYSGITTLHANNAENALARLEALCLTANLGLSLDDIRQMIASALRLIVFQERLLNGRRKVAQMVELKGLDEGRYVLQPLMRYDPAGDAFEFSGVKPGWVGG